ncbi:hypothetical protein Rleg4DRAFT_3259 [Rhizobium leguminosarum bv. trifolii WSM2297]|uniref:Lytic murein transglycosylase n=1 Tax=Rhizobium leguminosarum bv. trifolii WSM2297 TaxID=754762 RepID=J0W8R5_RHILT|nr:hypothetical protein Rleg4DRAFT_3259 [Rhizobium leguminosarum bv. trifolii WSM2297]
MTLHAPASLWPAGHLPHRWGDWLGALVSPDNSRVSAAKRQMGRTREPLVISPLVGEMAGRPEGGSLERRPDLLNSISIQEADLVSHP